MSKEFLIWLFVNIGVSFERFEDLFAGVWGSLKRLKLVAVSVDWGSFLWMSLVIVH